MLQLLKQTDDPIVLAGNERHDSMGHSEKYSTYTIFSCTSNQIICFSLIQASLFEN